VASAFILEVWQSSTANPTEFINFHGWYGLAA